MAKGELALIKLHSGKTIFGVSVGKFNADSPTEFKVCGEAGEPSLWILAGPQSGGYSNSVFIRNKC